MRDRSLLLPAGVLALAVLLAATVRSGARAQERPSAPKAAVSAPTPPPAARRRPPVRVATLSNGLRLLCRSNDAAEIVAVVCLVRAGLPDEPERQAGVAALTAEALLKGTETRSGRALLQAVAQAGGALRATPGFDFTEVALLTSTAQLEPALRLLADLLAHPRFDPEDVNAARETIRRRIATFHDDFTGASYQALTGLLYPTTPYGRPLNGYPDTLARLTAEDVRAFWKRTYVQNRMVVAVVGDIDSTRALTVAQKAFRDIPWTQAAAEPRFVERLPRPRLDAIERPGPAAQVMAGFLVPGVTPENYAVYAVLDAVIGGGKRARLFTNIREKHSLGYELGSFFQPLRHQSHLVAYVVTPPFAIDPRTGRSRGLVEPVKELLLDQFRQVADPGPTDAELVRAKAYVVGRYALRQERTRDQAKWLAWHEAMGLGHDFDERFPQRVQAVTREQVMAAAKQALEQFGVVVTYPPAPEER